MKIQLEYLKYFANKKDDRGFNKLELIVVLLICGILAFIAAPSFLSQANKSKQSEGISSIGALNRAQQAHLTDFSPHSGAVREEHSAEEYNEINENTFERVNLKPISTFSIDVDSASYSNVRRFITNGQLPPKDAVRIEEMINYFSYDYPQPKGDRPFSIATEISAAPWHEAHKLVSIGLQGKKVSRENIPPSNLVLLLDVSGSMIAQDKLPLVKSGLRLLLDRLTAKDRVSIVVYAGAAGLVLPPTPGNEKEKILAAIENLHAGGSTAGGQGIQLAYEVARRTYIPSGNNRVIMATDGDFNVGISRDTELVRLIEDYRDRGVFLTVLGFGMGNLKDSKMEQLADKGNGNYAYIDNLAEAKKIFVTEMAGTLLTIAKDVKVQVEFNPAKVQAYRLIGYENRLLNAEDFNDDRKDAGELGAGHSVTALYEIVLSEDIDDLQDRENSEDLMLVKLRYKDPEHSESQLIVKPVVSLGGKLEDTSNNFKFAAAVAQFGMILRDSEYKGSANIEQVLQLANQSRGADRKGYRAEFIRLVETSKTLESAEASPFASSIEDTGLGIQDSVNYAYSTRATKDAVFNYATSKHEREKSYVGAVFAREGEVSLSIICEAKSPGATKLADPTLENGVPTCPPGTKKLGN
ncbi:MAG: DUF3520 domain-containing protein [Oscillatoria sp. SIO1A7]|nr:DUF3520 domain-containing protein [Oscillatoria sp. SIO1A7]